MSPRGGCRRRSASSSWSTSSIVSTRRRGLREPRELLQQVRLADPGLAADGKKTQPGSRSASTRASSSSVRPTMRGMGTPGPWRNQGFPGGSPPRRGAESPRALHPVPPPQETTCVRSHCRTRDESGARRRRDRRRPGTSSGPTAARPVPHCRCVAADDLRDARSTRPHTDAAPGVTRSTAFVNSPARRSRSTCLLNQNRRCVKVLLTAENLLHGLERQPTGATCRR